jgi:hypothetical protein
VAKCRVPQSPKKGGPGQQVLSVEKGKEVRRAREQASLDHPLHWVQHPALSRVRWDSILGFVDHMVSMATTQQH